MRNKRMSRYVDIEPLDVVGTKGVSKDYVDGMAYVLDLLDNLPSADVAEVVRCRECIHNGSFDTDCPFGWRDERFNLPDDMDFCSYGER